MIDIHYLSVIPGAGKTHYAVRRMSRFILDRSDSEEYGYCIYVAPTTQLLQEVASRICELCAETSGSSQKYFKKFLHVVVRELNSRSSVQKSLKTLLCDTKIPPGSIILLTHEGFLRCADIPERHRMTVYFDEARSFVHEVVLKGFGDSIQVSKSVNLELSKFLLRNTRKFYPMEWSLENDTFIPSIDPSETHGILSCSKDDASKFLSGLDCGISPTSGAQAEFIHTLIHYATNPRLTLYVRLVDSSTFSLRKYAAHAVLSPRNAFVGFRNVLLMGAYLLDSQMYRMLEADPDVNLIPIRSNPRIEKLFSSRIRTIKKSFARIRFIALTNTTKLISARYLSDAVFVPANNFAAFERSCLSHGWDSEFLKVVRKLIMEFYAYPTSIDSLLEGSTLKRVCRQASPSLSKEQKLFLRTCLNLGVCISPPMDWLLAASVRETKGRQFLLSVNSKHQDRKDKLLDSFVVNNLAVDLPGSPHGLNTYQHIHDIAYLSARNLNPDTSLFFRSILPNYDATADHTANCVVQAITRTSLRNTDSESCVTVILPDLETARVARSKLGLDTESESGLRVSKQDGVIYSMCVLRQPIKESSTRKTFHGITKHPEYIAAAREVRNARRELNHLKTKRKFLAIDGPEHVALGERIDAQQIKLDQLTGAVASVRASLVRQRMHGTDSPPAYTDI